MSGVEQLAAVRARKLIIAWVNGDEQAALAVRDELESGRAAEERKGGYPYAEWELLTAMIGLFAVGDRLSVFGVNVDQLGPGQPVPPEVVAVLKADLEHAHTQPRKLALRLQIALVDADFHHIEARRLVKGIVDFWPLMLEFCDLIAGERIRQARAALVTKCVNGIDALLTTDA